MIILDGIQLPAGLVWTDEFSAARVAQTVRRTLDGGQVVFYAPIGSGIPITLESEADAGWLTRVQVEAIAARAASPGGLYTLVLRGQTYQVMFRHHEAPAFEARPLINTATPQPGDYFIAALKLMTL